VSEKTFIFAAISLMKDQSVKANSFWSISNRCNNLLHVFFIVVIGAINFHPTFITSQSQSKYIPCIHWYPSVNTVTITPWNAITFFYDKFRWTSMVC